MKVAKQPKKTDTPKRNNKLGVKRLTKRTTAEPYHITNVSPVVQNELSHLARTNSPIKVANCKNLINESSAGFVPSSVKIKLQLFPADEHTRIGLEKDRFCPYLELTLSPRKKISSVLKHIMTKWGSSGIAIGHPMLLSCTGDGVNSTNPKVWTLDDSTTCALDVFEELGRPSVFRLWYCWFLKCQPDPSASASIPASSYTHPDARDTHVDYYGSSNMKQLETAKQTGLKETCALNTADLSDENFFSASNYHADEDVREVTISDKSMLSWYDSFTNISIGGLLSEASLQGTLNIVSAPDACITTPKQDTSGLNALAASNGHQITSSLLDAEDTCSSFSFKKLHPSGIDAPAAMNTATKFPTTSSSQALAAQIGGGSPEAKTDTLLVSGVYDGDRSLGLRNIKWTDSLGPFDLLVPSHQGVRNGST